MKLTSKLAIVTAAFGVMVQVSPTNACTTIIGWIADLSKPGTKYSYTAKESGMAQMKFDYARPWGTITVQTHNVRDVRSIELRRVRTPGDLRGPVVARLYGPKSGPFTGKLTRPIGNADIVDVKLSKSDLGVANAFVHDGILVTVCTKSHPQGELAGVITMHRVISYSAVGEFHDPKLHKQAVAGGS